MTRRCLRSAAAGLSNLTFTGFVDNVGDYLAAFDVFILPSNREGIGSILLDAMEQGLPVVASRVGGVPDIVHDRENGLLIDPASPAQLRDAILHARARSRTCASAYGQRGREFAKDFTGEAMCRKYLALYESVLGRLDVERGCKAEHDGAAQSTLHHRGSRIGRRRRRSSASRTPASTSPSICPAGERRDWLEQNGVRVLDLPLRKQFDREAVRRLRAELDAGRATTSCTSSATRRCRTVSRRAAACP